MRIEYRRTFSQFVDNYLSKYYSTGTNTFYHLAGGPSLILVGILTVNYTRGISIPFFRGLFWLAGFSAAAYGILYTLLPLINIFLVWLRREDFLGPEGALISLELDTEDQIIKITDPEGNMELAFTEILRIQHRSDSAWIVTKSDQVISIPRENLLSGDHDAFISALEKILEENEQKF